MPSYGDNLYAKEVVCSGKIDVNNVVVKSSVSADSVAATGAVSGATVDATAHLVTGGLSLGASATTPASGSAVGELWFVAGNTGGSANSENGVHIWDGAAWEQVSGARGAK